jgi:UDPglucose--hexose-1-phosphate uridylyltransferase
MTREIRTDPYLGTVVHIVADRQNRPNLPVDGCPFCIGGLEAPTEYDVKSFANRWPALDLGYCEVVLYTPHHDANFGSLSDYEARAVIDLWAQRTAALQEMPKGEHVLVFENRGAEVGATISHPHGQIYAFDHVPARPAHMLAASWEPDTNPGERLILEQDNWRVYAEYASVHPISIRIAPIHRISGLIEMNGVDREFLASILVRVVAALDKMFETPLPYMMWLNQAPRTASDWPDAWFNIEIVSPWRAAHVPRYIAAAEVASGEYFNPVDPADVAISLRALLACE